MGSEVRTSVHSAELGDMVNYYCCGRLWLEKPFSGLDWSPREVIDPHQKKHVWPRNERWWWQPQKTAQMCCNSLEEFRTAFQDVKSDELEIKTVLRTSIFVLP